MRITKTLVCAFLVTFLIGYFSTAFIKLREAKTTFYPVYKVESAKTQAEIKPQINTPIVQIKTGLQLPVFKIEDFWDKSLPDNEYILETGEVSNGDDFTMKSGESWFGLFDKNGEFNLRSTKIKVKQTGNSDLAWKEISVREKKSPLFLVKKLKKLKEGKVKTIFRGHTLQEIDENDQERTSLKKGFTKSFRLGEKQYNLRVKEGFNEKEETIWVLLLETEESSQILHYIDYSGEDADVGNLYWVGDLDRDGKLDLYMDFWNYEKGYYSSGLFLSSEAEKGKLVKELGYFALSGC